MKLTKEQIQKIEHYLDARKITQIDLRMEVFDHIVSDIERLIIEENLFEDAFAMVRIRWQKHFKETNSFYFGIAYSAPNIVLKKAKSIYKKWFLIFFSAYIIPVLIIKNINFSISKYLRDNIITSIKIISVFLFFTFIFLLFKKYKTKGITTYSFVLKTQTWNLIFAPIMLFNFLFLMNNESINSLSIGVFSVFLFSVYSYYHFLKKHLEILKKYKIS